MLQPGDTLNHGAYRIERKLDTGGFGVVYLATEVALQRKVAIKTLKTEWAAEEPGVTEAIAAEARLTARLAGRIRCSRLAPPTALAPQELHHTGLLFSGG